MGFFDDVVSGIGSLAGAAAGVVRAIPGAQFTPLGAAATAVGDFASGGFAGLAGNVLGRATSLAPLVGSALGAPQLGTLAGSILGRLSPAGSFGGGFMGGQPNPGALAVGADPSLPYGGTMNPALMNLGRSQLPTTIPLRAPISQTGLINLAGGFGGGGSPSVTNVGGGSCYSAPLYFGSTRSQLLRAASANAGFRITWKKLLYILLSFGIEVAKRFTGLDEGAILWLYTTRPHRGRRGPHLRTIAKRARQVQGYRHSIARIARVLGAVRHHASFSRPPARRRHARR